MSHSVKWCVRWNALFRLKQNKVIFFIIWILGMPVCMAGGLQITPIRIHFSKDQSIETLRLTNQNETPMAMQLDIKAWDQEKGEDIYTSTQDVLITPPLFTLPPKQTQVVRVAVLKPRDPLKESAYRLIVREVGTGKPFQGLRMLLEMRLPVFIDPLQETKPTYTTQIRAVQNKEYEVLVENTGGRHLLIKELILLDKQKGKTLSQTPPLAYIFPGKTKAFLFKSEIALSPSSQLVAEVKH